MTRDSMGVDQTRLGLIDAFCVVASRDLTRYPSVVAVVKEAGCNRATFYRYFEDIFALNASMEDVVISHIAQKLAQFAPTHFKHQGLMDAFVSLDDCYHDYLVVLFSPLYCAHFEVKLKGAVAPVFAKFSGCDITQPREAVLLDMFFSAVLANVSRFIRDGATLERQEIVALNRSLLTQWLIPQLQACKVAVDGCEGIATPPLIG